MADRHSSKIKITFLSIEYEGKSLRKNARKTSRRECLKKKLSGLMEAARKHFKTASNFWRPIIYKTITQVLRLVSCLFLFLIIYHFLQFLNGRFYNLSDEALAVLLTVLLEKTLKIVRITT